MAVSIGIGVIGCGRVAVTAHLPAIAGLPDASVVALADTDRGRLTEAGDLAGSARRYADYRELFADPDVDAAVVGVPPALHAEVAAAGIRAGIHLLIEKPLAITLADADELIASAGAADVRIAVGFNLRRHRLVRAARRMIEQGEIESPRLISSAFTSAMGRADDMPAWRRRRATGGGVLYEIAVHHFDAWRYLLDADIEEVFARTRDAGSEDDEAVVTARLSDGTLATALFSQVTVTDNWIDLLAANGRLRLSLYRFDGLEWTPATSVPGAISDRARAAASSMRQLPAGLAAIREGGDFRTAYRAEWRHFLDCIRSGANPTPGLSDGRQAVAAVVAAIESDTTGAPVRLQ